MSIRNGTPTQVGRTRAFEHIVQWGPHYLQVDNWRIELGDNMHVYLDEHGIADWEHIEFTIPVGQAYEI